MKKQQKVELLNDVFTNENLNKTILDLIKNKIQFCKFKLHENYKKKPIDEISSIKRITEFKNTRRAYLKFKISSIKETYNV